MTMKSKTNTQTATAPAVASSDLRRLMKQATEWLHEVGEVVMFSAFAGAKPPGIEVERLVERIQLDSLREAAAMCRKHDGLSLMAAGWIEKRAEEIETHSSNNEKLSNAGPKTP